ncbi:MAG: tRNA 2-thiouridine(34) synthase MnmA, partial [Planctomycetes bacterium]|nr:tRNA 2-thiouridine(34) synthase MnmA [Planctomycetota bacterium]
MTGKAKKVFVALSGGVDSAAAAILLIEASFDCSAVFMVTSENSHQSQGDAQAVAEKLGIKFYVLDLRNDFKSILDYFCVQYRSGRTPNPCVFCNRLIKFGKLWDFAKINGADFLATGHYARIIKTQNEFGLYEAAHITKDQSYALAMIDKIILANVIFPLGDYSKSQARKKVSSLCLDIEKKAESQDICFIPNDDYVSVLEEMRPELVRTGKIIDSSGKILGEHNGIHKFTIGQRRGLGIALGQPHYVTKIDAENNIVTLGPKQELMHKKLTAVKPNWLMDAYAAPFRAKVKIRYNSKGAMATVTPKGDIVNVEFDEDV